MGINTPRPYREFEERVYGHREDLVRLIRALVADGKKVLGYGASTKGNVVLQFCGLTAQDIPAIAEVRSEEHTSELQSLMRISYADFCLKKKKKDTTLRKKN